MLQSNIDKLERHRPKLTEWVNDRTCHLGAQEKEEIASIIRQEFNPSYNPNLWCGPCVVDMLVYAFNELDNYLSSLKITTHELHTPNSGNRAKRRARR